MPAVSVIIPLHNKGPYIRETLESVLAQSFVDWEALAIENGSTDNGPALVEEMAFIDPRIRLIYAAPNVRGPGAARNIGIVHATAEWVLFLDADDLIAPDYLALHIETARENANADLLVAGSCKIKDVGDVPEIIPHSWTHLTKEALRDSAVASCHWSVHSVLVRRRLLGSELRWNEHLDQYLGEDINFWFRVLRKTSPLVTPSFGATYRYQTPGCRDRSSDPDAWFTGIDKVLESNVAFLRENGEEPSVEGCLALFRVYAALHERMRSHKRRDLCALASARVHEWFGAAMAHKAPLPWHLLLYRVVGLPAYNSLRSIGRATSGLKQVGNTLREINR